MNKIISYYSGYRQHTGSYNQFINEKKAKPALNSAENERLKTKAKTIMEPLLLLDSYEHEKAEDSEAFFQTYNIELMSITSLICSLPIALTKFIPALNKIVSTNQTAKTAVKAATAVTSLLGGLFYIKNIRKSMESQLGIIRKASFDATQNIINDPKLFAILTPQQQEEVKSIINYEQSQNSHFVDKLKDRVNIKSTFESVNEYRKTYSEYNSKKTDYFKQNELALSDEDKKLFSGLIKNVEHDVLEPLRKVETISNISFSALFTGGFLEYLITDKLVDVIGIKNKPLQMGIKIGVPLLTYLLLNKNISNIENKAILATKYKYLKHFIENPTEEMPQQKNQSFFEFLKTVLADMKEYDKFAQTELPKLKEKLDAKRQIELSEQQLKDAKSLQKNTAIAINNQREHVFNQSVGIKAFSETILGPIDIIATAIGGKIGYNLSKKCPNKRIAGMLTGIGAIIAFIPAAIIEAKLTTQQKLSEKIAAMLALKDINKTHKTFTPEVPSVFKNLVNI